MSMTGVTHEHGHTLDPVLSCFLMTSLGIRCLIIRKWSKERGPIIFVLLLKNRFNPRVVFSTLNSVIILLSLTFLMSLYKL